MALMDKEQIKKIIPHRADAGTVRHPKAAFKMEIKAAVIEVDRSDRCNLIIRNKGL